MRRLIFIFKALLIISLPIAILLSSFEIATFDLDYFEHKYEEYNITKVTGMNNENLMNTTEELLKYLKGDREDIIIKANIRGEITQVFKEREILHLEDVKALFIKGFLIRNISLIVAFLSLLILLVYEKGAIPKILTISAIYPIVLMAILGMLMKTDFNKYFTYFHEILFTNDLWLLDPKTEVLIQMYPLEFFYSIAFRIVKLYIFGLFSIFIIGIIPKIINKYKTNY